MVQGLGMGTHPDNGVQKKGISYVGWDVFLPDQSMSLLEGSRWFGVSLHQVHHALLADSKVRKIYQDFNVVRLIYLLEYHDRALPTSKCRALTLTLFQK